MSRKHRAKRTNSDGQEKALHRDIEGTILKDDVQDTPYYCANSEAHRDSGVLCKRLSEITEMGAKPTAKVFEEGYLPSGNGIFNPGNARTLRQEFDWNIVSMEEHLKERLKMDLVAMSDGESPIKDDHVIERMARVITQRALQTVLLQEWARHHPYSGMPSFRFEDVVTTDNYSSLSIDYRLTYTPSFPKTNTNENNNEGEENNVAPNQGGQNSNDIDKMTENIPKGYLLVDHELSQSCLCRFKYGVDTQFGTGKQIHQGVPACLGAIGHVLKETDDREGEDESKEPGYWLLEDGSKLSSEQLQDEMDVLFTSTPLDDVAFEMTLTVTLRNMSLKETHALWRTRMLKSKNSGGRAGARWPNSWRFAGYEISVDRNGNNWNQEVDLEKDYQESDRGESDCTEIF